MTAPSLIERLEGASAGSREMDAEVWVALRPTSDPDVHRQSYDADPDAYWFWIAPSPVTTSLDAALALAERVNMNGPSVLHRNSPTEWGFTYADDDTAYAATPALTLCIAILRSRKDTL